MHDITGHNLDDAEYLEYAEKHNQILRDILWYEVAIDTKKIPALQGHFKARLTHLRKRLQILNDNYRLKRGSE